MVWLRIILFVTLLALMVAQGMQIPVGSVRASLRRLDRLARAFLAIAVVAPLVAWAVIALVHPWRPVAIAIALMAASPLAPFTLPKLLKDPAGRDLAAFHLALSLATVVITPAVLAISGRLFHFPFRIGLWPVARLALFTQFVPVLAGFLVAARWPQRAPKISRVLTVIATVVFVALAVVILVLGVRPLLALGWHAAAAIVLTTVLSLAGGHFLAWDRESGRTLLATESAVRNPALAMVLARTLFPQTPAGPFLVPYLLLVVLVSGAYTSLRKRGGRRPRPLVHRHAEA